MRVYWEYQQDVLVKSIINKLSNEIEAPSIDDVVPDGNGGVRIKNQEEKFQEFKEQKFLELRQNYAIAAAHTDARILQYQKRKELGILTEDDESDYQEALNYYKKITEQYRQKKAELEQLTDLEQLKTFDTSIA